jgi:hypothetical protein
MTVQFGRDSAAAQALFNLVDPPRFLRKTLSEFLRCPSVYSEGEHSSNPCKKLAGENSVVISRSLRRGDSGIPRRRHFLGHGIPGIPFPARFLAGESGFWEVRLRICPDSRIDPGGIRDPGRSHGIPCHVRIDAFSAWGFAFPPDRGFASYPMLGHSGFRLALLNQGQKS